MGKSEKFGAERSLVRSNILFAVAAMLFTIFVFKQQDEHAWTLYTQLAEFHANTPFQFRILVPALVSAFRGLLPFFSIEAAYHFLTFLIAYGLLIVFREYLKLFSPRVGNLVPLLIFYPLFWNLSVLNPIFVPSDLSGLFFITAGLILIYRKNWRFFYAIYPLAIFNRETAIYLTIMMIVTARGRMTLRSTLLHTLAQLSIWVLVKYLLSMAFVGGTSGLFVNTLQRNITYLEEIFTLRIPARSWLTLFGLVWIPGLTRWRALPLFVRRLFLVLIPAFIVLTIAGELEETRIFTDLIIIVTTPTALLLLNRTGNETRT